MNSLRVAPMRSNFGVSAGKTAEVRHGPFPPGSVIVRILGLVQGISEPSRQTANVWRRGRHRIHGWHLPGRPQTCILSVKSVWRPSQLEKGIQATFQRESIEKIRTASPGINRDSSLMSRHPSPSLLDPLTDLEVAELSLWDLLPLGTPPEELRRRPTGTPSTVTDAWNMEDTQ